MKEFPVVYVVPNLLVDSKIYESKNIESFNLYLEEVAKILIIKLIEFHEANDYLPVFMVVNDKVTFNITLKIFNALTEIVQRELVEVGVIISLVSMFTSSGKIGENIRAKYFDYQRTDIPADLGIVGHYLLFEIKER